MRKNWNIKEQTASLRDELTKELSISPLAAQLLVNRGIKDADAARFFMKPSLLSLYEPLLMKDMEKAVARIKKAAANRERIVIYGDYDVDGICSTALLCLALKKIGTEPEYYIPNRLDEGYGLNRDAIRAINNKGADLLITVDCGITALEEVTELNNLGIDVIITDHHTAGAKIPDAFAVLNPMRTDCSYPDKSLAGVGVAFKLATALLGKDNDFLYEQLDIVCLGTIADVVPIIGENRILVKNGLHQLSHTKKPGLAALIDEASIKDRSDISSYHIGYILAPRINATGRLGSADLALKLILTENEDEAKVLAKQLNDENRTRQKLEEKVLKEALTKVENEVDFTYDKVIVLYEETWHKGVIGIVASRLVDRFYRPVFIFAGDGTIAKGSARSIKGFHLFDILKKCAGLLDNFGGHKYAAGVSLKVERLVDLKQKLNDIAEDIMQIENFVPSIEIDSDIPISVLNKEFLKELDMFEPFGIGNQRPIFSTSNLTLKCQPRILKGNTLKIWVTDGESTAEVIGFGMADVIPSDPLNQRIDLAYTCDLNTYNGITSLQLKIKDLRVSV